MHYSVQLYCIFITRYRAQSVRRQQRKRISQESDVVTYKHVNEVVRNRCLKHQAKWVDSKAILFLIVKPKPSPIWTGLRGLLKLICTPPPHRTTTDRRIWALHRTLLSCTDFLWTLLNWTKILRNFGPNFRQNFLAKFLTKFLDQILDQNFLPNFNETFELYSTGLKCRAKFWYKF